MAMAAWLGLIAGLASGVASPGFAAVSDNAPAAENTSHEATMREAMVAESLGQGTVRFFADAAARDNALPSYALEKEIAGTPAPANFPVRPRFETVDGKAAVKITIEPGTSLYGTGEVAGPLLRNGRRTTCWNFDAYGYGDEAEHLYKSHPWVLAVRKDGTAYGILADTTYRCVVDTAAARPDEIQFIADGPAFPVIVIERSHPAEVLKELGRLTGLMPMPPKWSIGYHQCRYSYFPEARVREIAREFRERKIPCDVIWFDIDYMAGFRIFVFNRDFFPDPKKLNTDLQGQGFKTVWMIDPGIKSRDDNSINDPTPAEMAKWPEETRKAMESEWARFREIRDSGLENDLYVKQADGKVYEGKVWPGFCYFPDYTDRRVRGWWAGLYGDFMANGIDGVWNDMNEPAVFDVTSKTMPLDNRHAGDPAMIAPNGSPQGERAAGDHARYHNVYGLMMVKASREGIMAANPDKRPFVLSRASYIGGQRYHAGWSGDNTANWYHLETSIPMVLNMGLSGFTFYGPDIGGFAADGDGPLFARWMGFGALLPFSRGHTGKENRDKEPWSFGPEVEQTSRVALERRYRLLPFFYTLFREASVTGMPVARPTFFADVTDQALRAEDDSFLLGSDLLVSCQVVPDARACRSCPRVSGASGIRGRTRTCRGCSSARGRSSPPGPWCSSWVKNRWTR